MEHIRAIVGGAVGILLLLSSPAPGGPLNDPASLVDFSGEDPSTWSPVNDGVMGGLSRSAMRITEEGTGVFSGVLSLENNGGFASVRVRPKASDLSAHLGLAIRVRGDGRTYQLRLRTDDRFDGVAYRAVFDTVENEWLTVRIPFAEFVPTFRGRVLDDVPALDTRRISQMALMVADKRSGAFVLEIESIRAFGQ